MNEDWRPPHDYSDEEIMDMLVSRCVLTLEMEDKHGAG